MGSLACDEGEAATPAPGAARRDALEPSLRARFKDMQKIGEGTYGVACQRSKKVGGLAWRVAQRLLEARDCAWGLDATSTFSALIGAG